MSSCQREAGLKNGYVKRVVHEQKREYHRTEVVYTKDGTEWSISCSIPDQVSTHQSLVRLTLRIICHSHETPNVV